MAGGSFIGVGGAGGGYDDILILDMMNLRFLEMSQTVSRRPAAE